MSCSVELSMKKVYNIGACLFFLQYICDLSEDDIERGLLPPLVIYPRGEINKTLHN